MLDRAASEALPDSWHLGVVMSKLPSIHIAFGGGGIGGLIIHIIIWHEIWRLVRYVWHIHTYGPFIDLFIIALIIGAVIWRRQRGSWRPRRVNSEDRDSGYSGSGSGTGPRDW
jgi:hypothetical protein